MMTQNDVGLKFRHRAADSIAEGRLELPGHPGRHITVARAGVRHFIRHTHDCERQLFGMKEDRQKSDSLGKYRLILGIHSGYDHLRMSLPGKHTHKFRKKHAASRAARLLSCNIQYLHFCSPFVRIVSTFISLILT